MMRFLPAATVVGAVLVGLFACGDDDPGEPLAPDASAPDGTITADAPTRSPFGLDARPANPTCKAPARPPSTSAVKFEQVYTNINLAQPMVMVQRPGDSSRWYVARRVGAIAWFPTQNPATMTEAVSLDPSNGPVVAGAPGVISVGECGLLGFAFHPKFAQNGKAYVSFTGPPRANPTIANSTSESIIAELTSTDGGNTFTSYKKILGFDQTNITEHKGSGLAFGPDGFLYSSFGDGSPLDDIYARAQKKVDFFSKVIRIDVDNPAPGLAYGIPDGNPFKNGGGEPATYAMGFRNPFRLTFDTATGDLWVADVGQFKWEEIDKVVAGGNYGWPCREGAHDYIADPNRCPSKVGILDPAFEYEHPATPQGGTEPRSISGGVVYRGKAIPSLDGAYLYADWMKAELWAANTDPISGAPKHTLLNDQGTPSAGWIGWSQDNDGEAYPLSLVPSAMYKLVPAASAPDTFPDRLSKTGCVDAADAKRPAPGLIPYTVNAELWSDGAEKTRFVALPDGKTIGVKADGDFDLPIGSVVVKSFKVGGKLVETRLLVRHEDGGWGGYTYEWNDEQTDAVLLRGSKRKNVAGKPWYFPSRGDCARCHTEAAGRTLGLELAQLNGDLVYESTGRISNQLDTLDHIGLFDVPLGKPHAELPAYPRLDQNDAPIDARARAYLHANCSFCHRPEGGGRGKMDLRFGTPFKDTATCNLPGEVGPIDAATSLLVPGAPASSILSLRVRSLGPTRMPPLASSIVDEAGAKAVDAWIASLAGCP